MKMLNKIAPNMDPCRTPDNRSLKTLSTYVI